MLGLKMCKEIVRPYGSNTVKRASVEAEREREYYVYILHMAAR